MNVTADILLMLAAFSLKAQFIAKAVIYGRAGLALFPEDRRFREVLAYALFLAGELENSAAVAGEARRDTRNFAYVRARLAMLSGCSGAEGQSAIRAYLGKMDS